MRVCPKCGYVDPQYWRKGQGDHYGDTDICRLEDLELNEPELAKVLKGNRESFDEHYAYKLLGKGVWVRRRWLEIYKIQRWKMIPYDRDAKKRAEAKLGLKQKKLLEV